MMVGDDARGMLGLYSTCSVEGVEYENITAMIQKI